jgi:DNA segregation ATPase FtsK/SpoIIIE, S-DNA-T family
MAKKKSIDNHTKKNQTKEAILGICAFLVALLSLLAAFAKAGIIGEYVFSFLSKLFGIGYYLIPIVFVMLGISYLRGTAQRLKHSQSIGSTLFFISGLGIIYLLPEHAGGIIGRWLATPLLKMFDLPATASLLGAILIISILVTFNIHITWEGLAFWRRFGRSGDEEVGGVLDDNSAIDKAVADAEAGVMDSVVPVSAKALALAEAQRIKEKMEKDKPKRGGLLSFSDDEEKAFASSVVLPFSKAFNPPPLNLLEKDRGKPETGDIKANANIIKRTLQNFNITVEMDEISIGPTVTRYALKPAEGVKLSKIVGLNNDLALALAAHPIRSKLQFQVSH